MIDNCNDLHLRALIRAAETLSKLLPKGTGFVIRETLHQHGYGDAAFSKTFRWMMDEAESKSLNARLGRAIGDGGIALLAVSPPKATEADVDALASIILRSRAKEVAEFARHFVTRTARRFLVRVPDNIIPPFVRREVYRQLRMQLMEDAA